MPPFYTAATRISPQIEINPDRAELSVVGPAVGGLRKLIEAKEWARKQSFRSAIETPNSECTVILDVVPGKTDSNRAVLSLVEEVGRHYKRLRIFLSGQAVMKNWLRDSLDDISRDPNSKIHGKVLEFVD